MSPCERRRKTPSELPRSGDSMEDRMRTGTASEAPNSWRIAAAAFALTALSEPAPAQETAPLAAADLARIEDAIETTMSRWQIPGLSIAVVKGDGVLWQAGFGLADLENAVPARPGTVYRIASVTKSITAVLAMQLVERGELDLDAPIQRYVPSFPEKPWSLTAGQLLGHLAGVRNYREDDFGGLPDNTRRYASLTEALGIFASDPLLQEPGTKYVYTTFGYTLLGAAIEGASGGSFVDTLRANVLEPAK